MRSPLCISTRGLLSKNTTTIAVRGYLCETSVLIKSEKQDWFKRFADESDILPIRKFNLPTQDDEILTILKVFIACQDRVLRN